MKVHGYGLSTCEAVIVLDQVTTEPVNLLAKAATKSCPKAMPPIQVKAYILYSYNYGRSLILINLRSEMHMDLIVAQGYYSTHKVPSASKCILVTWCMQYIIKNNVLTGGG